MMSPDEALKLMKERGAAYAEQRMKDLFGESNAVDTRVRDVMRLEIASAFLIGAGAAAEVVGAVIGRSARR